MINLITIIIIILLFLEPIGLPLILVHAVLSAVTFHLVITRRSFAYPYAFGFGLLIDLLTLDTLGITSILAIVLVGTYQFICLKFGDSAQSSLFLATLAFHLLRQYLQGEPFQWISVIVLSLATWIFYQLLVRIDTAHTIQLRQSSLR